MWKMKELLFLGLILAVSCNKMSMTMTTKGHFKVAVDSKQDCDVNLSIDTITRQASLRNSETSIVVFGSIANQRHAMLQVQLKGSNATVKNVKLSAIHTPRIHKVQIGDISLKLTSKFVCESGYSGVMCQLTNEQEPLTTMSSEENSATTEEPTSTRITVKRSEPVEIKEALMLEMEKVKAMALPTDTYTGVKKELHDKRSLVTTTELAKSEGFAKRYYGILYTFLIAFIIFLVAFTSLLIAAAVVYLLTRNERESVRRMQDYHADREVERMRIHQEDLQRAINKCTPDSPFIILFAYSNDFDSQIVQDTIESILLNDFSSDSPKINFLKLANVRFDVKESSPDILFHDTVEAWNSSMYDNLPDSKLGYDNDGVGSDVLNIFPKLLNSSNSCGSRIILLLKRFPVAVDIHNLMLDLQKTRIFLQVAGSSTPIGIVSNFWTMYQLAFESNGIYVSADDSRVSEIASTQLTSIYDMSLIYISNPSGGGKSQMELSEIKVPNNIYDPDRFNAFIMVNVQNNVIPDNFESFELRLTDKSKNTVFQTFSVSDIDQLEDGSTVFSTLFDLPTNVTSCRVIWNSEFSGRRVNSMEIRIFTRAQSTFSASSSCSQDDPFIILFAYSNDFDKNIIENCMGLFQLYSTEMDRPNFSKLAHVRFDVKEEEEIEYHDDFPSVFSSVMGKLPDPTLSFDSKDIGSDATNVLRKLINNKAAPVCGARVILLLKRLSNETIDSTTQLLADLQKNHVTVQTAASRNQTGGHYLDTMYKLSADSNGVYIFNDDIVVPAYATTILSSCYEMSLVYAANPRISGGVGQKSLVQKVPVLDNLVDTYYGQNAYLMINVVDNEYLDIFNSLKFSLIDSNNHLVYNVTIPDRQTLAKETLWATGLELPSTPSAGGYQVVLDYDYSPDVARNFLEIRIYTYASWQNSILARLPDPEISFGSVEIGSDVLNVFRNLMLNKVTNACGARVITLLKRYSNEVDVTDLIVSLQRHHIFVQTMGSLVPSGGLNRQAMYDVSKGSNGIYVFGDDNKMSTFVPSHLDSIFELSLIYAVNPYVTGKDSEGLPMLICPTRMPRQGSGNVNSYMIINVQDDGHLDKFNSLTVWIVDNDGDTAFKQHVVKNDIENGVSYTAHLMNLYEQPYNYTVMFAYDYAGPQVTNVEIRIYAYVHEPIWPPYDY